MQIRVAQLDDIETLFHIRTRVTENYQSREELADLGVTPAAIAILLQTDGRAWIAEIDQQPVGFSIVNAAENTIFGLFVLPDFEGRGVGRSLMQHAENWLWLQNSNEIWLLTENNPNLRAYGFYQHLGWLPDEVQPDGQIKFIKQRSSTPLHS
jgi:GNAT superfamily N-acetyltransferase